MMKGDKMIKNLRKAICFLIIIGLLFSTSTSFAIEVSKKIEDKETKDIFISTNKLLPLDDVEDYDELLDTKITFTLEEIRAYDKIDFFGAPDFYVKIFINEKEFRSPIWKNMNYVKEPDCSWTVDVPDDTEYVNIKIQLWDKNIGRDKLCDISGNYGFNSKAKEINLIYSIKTGHWFGDDKVNHYPEWDDRGDSSGYGRLCGCDDGSIYENDLDCELWFDITQNDYDKDGITYWMETNIYNTDPTVNDIGQDYDNDGVPIEWEYKWGHIAEYDNREKKWVEGFIYDPFTWENHSSLDPDEDGLDNIEEYKAEKEGFRTDPHRKDILLEIDQMKPGPNGEGATVPELSKDLLWDAYGKHNIVFQIDDQGRVIPFQESTSGWHGPDLQNIYFKYFMNENESYWRRGAFHYAPIIYKSEDHPGNMWVSLIGDWDGTYNFSENRNNNVSAYGDCFQVSTCNHEKIPYRKPLIFLLTHRTFDKEKQRAIIYATAMMHETGHVLGIFHDNSEGCDNREAVKPWQPLFWIYFRYRSCMNYAWMYQFVDYSDGSNGKYDKNDWENIDLTLFQQERNQYYNN